VFARVAGISALVVAAAAVLGAQGAPPALQAMADTERAFAKLAADTNFRDAFIAYFADEAVGFDPNPGPARERLRAQPAPPADLRLLWEPRVGDVSAAGDLGYLTGPTETHLPGKPTRYGSYFSVWKKQADGEYRVILDVGIGVPAAVPFGEGFVRAAGVAAYAGRDTTAEAEASLLAADRSFGASLTARGPAASYAEVLHPAARVHRNGLLPMTSRDAATGWMRTALKAMTSEPLKSETASSRDLGYTWGAFTEAPMTGLATTGSYVRLWTRRADGTWRMVADITQGR